MEGKGRLVRSRSSVRRKGGRKEGREGGRGEGGRTLGRCLRIVSMSPYFLIRLRADLGPMPRMELV